MTIMEAESSWASCQMSQQISNPMRTKNLRKVTSTALGVASFSLMCAILMAPIAHGSGATVINFDDLTAPCTFDQTRHLTNRYAASGVIFQGPGAKDGFAILNECSSFGVSGYSSPNFLAFSKVATLQDGGVPQGPETILFNPAVSHVQMLVGAAFSAGSSVTLDAYDDCGNALVATTNIILQAGMAPLSVSAGAIAKVIVTSLADEMVVDDLQFEPYVPPAIRVQRTGNVLALSWPIAGNSCFVLESCANLPSGPWTPFPSAPVQISGQNVVFIQMSAARGYYRLHR
jgi:hypothetical protein